MTSPLMSNPDTTNEWLKLLWVLFCVFCRNLQSCSFCCSILRVATVVQPSPCPMHYPPSHQPLAYPPFPNLSVNLWSSFLPAWQFSAQHHLPNIPLTISSLSPNRSTYTVPETYSLLILSISVSTMHTNVNYNIFFSQSFISFTELLYSWLRNYV